MLMTKQELPVDDDRPRGKMKLATARVDDEERSGRTDAYRRLTLHEQDADLPWPSDRDVRLRVVVGEDLAVAVAVPGVPLGPPLAHPDTVAPAATVEQENRPAQRRRWKREGHDHRYDSDPHRGSATIAAPGPTHSRYLLVGRKAADT
jgi:hypothetical protein